MFDWLFHINKIPLVIFQSDDIWQNVILTQL